MIVPGVLDVFRIFVIIGFREYFQDQERDLNFFTYKTLHYFAI